MTNAATLSPGDLESAAAAVAPLRTHFTLSPINEDEDDGAGCYLGPIVSPPRRQSRPFLTVPRGSATEGQGVSLYRGKGFSASPACLSCILRSPIHRATGDDAASPAAEEECRKGKLPSVSSLVDPFLRS